jgi:hypothetical protein
MMGCQSAETDRPPVASFDFDWPCIRRPQDDETVKSLAGRRAGVVAIGGLLALVASVGCTSHPKAVEAPAYDPQEFASFLLARCDADGNDSLIKSEAELAPGLLSRWSRYDADRDGMISRAELESHVQEWVDRGDGMASITCVVRLKNRQIGDVSVRLIPDEAFSGKIHSAETVSHPKFPSFLSIPAEYKHPAHAKLAGMQYGLYRVEVTHPSLNLVPSADSRGVDVSPADQAAPIRISVEQQK